MPGDFDLTDLWSKPFTAAQAADHGFSLAVVRKWLRNGDVRRVVQGVYVGSHLPDTPTLRARAVAAFLPSAVICGRTAAWMWGIGAAGTHDSSGRPLPAEFGVPTGTTLPRRSGCLGRIRNFEKGDVTTIAGVQVTTPLRTAADIGRTEPLQEAVVILDAFLHGRQMSKRQLEATAERFAGFAGVRRLIEAVRLADAGSTGAEETRLRLALTKTDVPPAEPGWRVMSAFGRVLHRFSLAWPELHLAVDVARPNKPAGAIGSSPTAREDGRVVSTRSLGTVAMTGSTGSATTGSVGPVGPVGPVGAVAALGLLGSVGQEGSVGSAGSARPTGSADASGPAGSTSPRKLGSSRGAPRAAVPEAAARASLDGLPAIRVRSRSIGGVTWRVVECGEGEVIANGDLVIAHVRHELLSRSAAGPEPARQAA